jgi:hypothetical protein
MCIQSISTQLLKSNCWKTSKYGNFSLGVGLASLDPSRQKFAVLQIFRILVMIIYDFQTKIPVHFLACWLYFQAATPLDSSKGACPRAMYFSCPQQFMLYN